MIGFSELAIVMAVIGFIMVVASVFYDKKAAQLQHIGVILLIAGIGLYFLLYIIG